MWTHKNGTESSSFFTVTESNYRGWFCNAKIWYQSQNCILHIYLLPPSQSGWVIFVALCCGVWAHQFASFARGERALVIFWAARSTQSKCAIEMKVFPASAHWMNEAKAMTGILHWHANSRSWESLCPGVINYILMILSSCLNNNFQTQSYFFFCLHNLWFMLLIFWWQEIVWHSRHYDVDAMKYRHNSFSFSGLISLL